MIDVFRSDCPINFAVEIFGDKWSLLIIRDMIFAGKSTYVEFSDSEEKVASNILSNRLKKLEEMGIIQKHHDPGRKTKTKVVYLLTPQGLSLIPMLVEIVLWSGQQRRVSGVSQDLVDEAQRDKVAFIQKLRKNAEHQVTIAMKI